MSNKINENDVVYHQNETHSSAALIDSRLGAENNFSMGISKYFLVEFGESSVHEDQEGFYVIEGSGAVKIGNEVIEIFQGDSFIVPCGTPHTLKKNKDSKELKVLWCHGAV